MISLLFSSHSIAFIEGVGGPELLMIMVIVLMLFGGKKLPELAKGLGKSMREFKKATSGVEEEFKRAMEEEPERPRIAPAKTTSTEITTPTEIAAKVTPATPADAETVTTEPASTPAKPEVTVSKTDDEPAPKSTGDSAAS